MNETLYNKLVEVARAREVIRYAEIAPLVGLDMNMPEDRTEIGRLLGEISYLELQKGHPLLSVVVVHQENKIPGQGFFTLARDLHIYDGDDDLQFFIKELNRVYDFWCNN